MAQSCGNYLRQTRRGSSPECDHNWELVGYEWDPELHEQAVELIRNGNFTLIEEEERWRLSDKVVTEKDLKA